MDPTKRDKTKVDPLTAAEEKEPAAPLKTVPEGQTPNATTAVIPGTGHVVTDEHGKEIVRVADQEWGDRWGELEDPFGHRWGISTMKQDAPG